MLRKTHFTKFTSVLLAVVMLMTLMLPALAEEEAEAITLPGKTEASAEKVEVPYIRDYGGGETVEGTTNLYFIDGGDIPYVALSEFMDLYSEFMENAAGLGKITFEVERVDDHEYRVTRTDRDECAIWIDVLEDTIIFEDFNAFIKGEGVTASTGIMDLPEPQQINLSELMEALKTVPDEEKADFITNNFQTKYEPESLFVTAFDTINRKGDIVELKLNDYLIDLVEQEGECFLPLQTMNDLLIINMYFNLIYNDIALYCVPNESQLLEEVYQAEPQQMSQEFALFNYNELRFLLDCKYGLKAEHNIPDFGTLLATNTDLAAKLTSTDPDEFDDALAQVLLTYFDDSHSAFLKPSWRSTGEPNSLSYFGLSSTHINNSMAQFASARAEAFPNGVPMYQEIGDTAFITFDSFVGADPADYYHLDEINPDEFFISVDGDGDEEGASAPDTIKLFYYAYQMITREGSPIRNVVVDLSNNGGGMSHAAVYVLTWMLGRADIAIRDTFTGAESIMRIASDLEFRETYDSATTSMLALGYNLYCMTSVNSFSCGNLVPAGCKMSEQVTLIGKRSGGGSCVVQPCTSASGTVFQISGEMQLSTIRNGSFYNIDQGIEPDVALTKIESFYDREGLVDMIHDLK